MSLALIGAGFGRTGTESMKQALEELGLGPCHHMKEVLPNPEQLAFWRAAVKGERSDWDEGLRGFRSAVDWPSALFWRELSEYYPDAKVLLTVRSPESWYRSFSATILPVIASDPDPDRIGNGIIRRVFDGRAVDPDHAMAVFERNTAEVQATIPPERLLTYHVGDGWEPLCAFLGKPVPEREFPPTNSTREFQDHFAGKQGDAP